LPEIDHRAAFSPLGYVSSSFFTQTVAVCGQKPQIATFSQNNLTNVGRFLRTEYDEMEKKDTNSLRIMDEKDLNLLLKQDKIPCGFPAFY
jgi:hypothetical protein